MKPYPALVAVAAASILIGIVGNWHGDFVWDEGIWIDNLRLFEEHGLSTEFLLGMKGQAPGPLWQLVHALFEPITGLHAGRMRLLNLLLTFVMLGALGRAISQWKAVERPHVTAFAILCVPGIALMAGTAMTEIPTLLFAVGCVHWTLRYILSSERPTWERLAMAALSGALLGVTVLGRANFLAMAFAAPCLMLLRRVRADWKVVTTGSLLSLGFALAISGPVFRIWGGFVPPEVADQVQVTLDPWNAILACIQLTVVVLVLAPSWFKASPREYAVWGLFGLVLFAANYAWIGWEHQTEIVRLALTGMGAADSGIGPLLAHATPAGFIAYCCFFLVRAIRHALAHCREVVPLYGFLSATLLVAGMTLQPLNFGVRSSAQIAPFLALALAPRILTDRGSFALKLLGLGLGNFFLWSQLAQW